MQPVHGTESGRHREHTLDIGPRLAPRHSPPAPCALSGQLSFEPCRNLILIGIKLLGNYPSKET